MEFRIPFEQLSACLRACAGLTLNVCLCASIPSAASAAEDEATPPRAAPATTDPSSSDGGTADELAKRVEAVTQKMEQAKSQLAERQTGSATQELQKAILAELDELLKSPPQPPKPNAGGSGGGSSSSSSGGSKSSSSSGRTSKPAGAADSKSPQSQTSDSGEQAGSKRDRQQAEDSEERTGEERASGAPVLPRRRLEVDVWGHLPEKVREKLLSAYGERMVPQYEDLVQRFYRSLAEEGTSNQTRRPPR